MLEAAAHLFGTQRFHEVRMDDVASVAGVGKGTIYRYFEDKDELYLALLARAGDQLSERFRLEVAAAVTPLAKLEALTAAVLTFFDEQPHVFDLIQRADAQRGLDTPWQKTRDDAYRLVPGILHVVTDRGNFTSSDPPIAALIVLCAFPAVMPFGPRPLTSVQTRP